MNKPSLTTLLALSLACLVLASCGEKPQTLQSSHKRSDSPAYEGAPDDPFVVKGWTPGDRVSWQNQIRERNQFQNENKRIGQ